MGADLDLSIYRDFRTCVNGIDRRIKDFATLVMVDDRLGCDFLDSLGSTHWFDNESDGKNTVGKGTNEKDQREKPGLKVDCVEMLVPVVHKRENSASDLVGVAGERHGLCLQKTAIGCQ